MGSALARILDHGQDAHPPEDRPGMRLPAHSRVVGQAGRGLRPCERRGSRLRRFLSWDWLPRGWGSPAVPRPVHFHAPQLTRIFSPPPVAANPLVVPSADFEVVWNKTVAVVDKYFDIASENRLSRTIVTQPKTGRNPDRALEWRFGRLHRPAGIELFKPSAASPSSRLTRPRRAVTS